MNYEWIGITGTIFILIAFSCDTEKRIRILDMAGAMLFTIYGLCISSVSTVLLNGILIAIQITKLYKIGKTERSVKPINIKSGYT